MPGLLFEITSASFFLFLTLNAISWLKLWEDKEFKWKRVFIHLRETREGRKILFGSISLIKWALVLAYGVTIVSSNFDDYYHFSIFVLYLFLAARAMIKIYNKEFVFPTFSRVSIFILFLTFSFELLLFVVPLLDRFLWILVLDRILPLIIGFLILIFFVFFDFSSDILINKALKKIHEHRNLLVIAVVGSYGKGTTKEFIARVLTSRFNALETKTSFNTPERIAQTIIKGLTEKKQIFIAEMEDYKFGEIQEMCNITIPKIAVICGINDQNISMFSTFDSLLDSKFQVIESLPRDGIGLFNANNIHSLALYERTKNKKFSYGTDESKIKNPDILASNIREARFSTSFDIQLFGKKYKNLNIKLLGRQSVENLLPSIFIGSYVGIDIVLIRKILRSLRPLAGTMNPRISENNVVLVDDTYNANYNSVISAVNYMRIYRGKKILVLEPLIELGQNAKKDHIALGEEIGKVCNFLFLTNENFSNSINTGVNRARGSCKAMILPPAKISTFISKNCQRQDVVVFEGRGAKLALLGISQEAVSPT